MKRHTPIYNNNTLQQPRPTAGPGEAYLDLFVRVHTELSLGQEPGLPGCLVGLQVLPVLPDVGPRPHPVEPTDVNLQDAFECIAPPVRETACTHTQTHTHTHTHTLDFVKDRLDLWIIIFFIAQC